jgi:hypothetical protein
MIPARPGLRAVYKFEGNANPKKRKVYCGDERVDLQDNVAAVCGLGDDTEIVTGDAHGFLEYIEVHHRSEGAPSDEWISRMAEREELHLKCAPKDEGGQSSNAESHA